MKQALCALGVIVLVLTVSSSADAQEWVKTYGGGNSDSDCSIQQTSDGGYVVAGRTYSFGVGSADFWVLKLNPDGTVGWEKTYGGTGQDWASSIQETSSHLGPDGYIVAGTTDSFGAVWQDMWLVRLNTDGTVAWQRIFDLGVSELATAVRQTADEGYIVAGYSAVEPGTADVWIIRLDANGNIVWQNTYGGTGWDTASSIEQTDDGGYIVAGQTDSFGAGNYDVWVFKLDSDGNVEWEKTYGGTELDSAASIDQTLDQFQQPDGYIVAGETSSLGTDSYDMWVLKLDTNGAIVWQKTYGGSQFNDAAGSIEQTSDGGYIVAGSTLSFGAGDWDFWLLRLDSGGDVVWEKTYGGSGWDTHPFVRETQDGGYVTSGYTKSFGVGGGGPWSGSGDILVLKLDANGNIPGCSVGEISTAIVFDTTMIGQNSVAAVQVPTPNITDTYASAQDSLAEVSDPCAAPTADCSADTTSGNKPLTVQFTDESTGSVTAWSWDFDNDGTVDSTIQNPAWTYNDAGDYTVSLAVTGPGGGDTALKEAFIHVSQTLCECNFTPDNTVVPRGDTLGFQAGITNNTGGTGMVLFGTKVTKPNATQTGFIWGPLQVWLTPYQTKSGHKTHRIPSGFQLGTYTYHGYVGRFGHIYYECQFDFEVVP
jgi:uncharacterized delta-60 repeat protein